MAEEKSYELREITSEVTKLIFLIQATNALSEQAASAVRRNKTFLASTLRQQRLNHCMIFHKEPTYSLSFLECAIDLISIENRKKGFWKFTLKYLSVLKQ